MYNIIRETTIEIQQKKKRKNDFNLKMKFTFNHIRNFN